MATHKIVHEGTGVAKILVDAASVTITGTGERGVTLSAGTHEITFGIAGQAGLAWKVAVVANDDDGTTVFKRSGKIPKSGLEVRTDTFEVAK